MERHVNIGLGILATLRSVWAQETCPSPQGHEQGASSTPTGAMEQHQDLNFDPALDNNDSNDDESQTSPQNGEAPPPDLDVPVPVEGSSYAVSEAASV
jgi:hypothetical protein